MQGNARSGSVYPRDPSGRCESGAETPPRARTTPDTHPRPRQAMRSKRLAAQGHCGEHRARPRGPSMVAQLLDDLIDAAHNRPVAVWLSASTLRGTAGPHHNGSTCYARRHPRCDVALHALPWRCSAIGDRLADALAAENASK